MIAKLWKWCDKTLPALIVCKVLMKASRPRCRQALSFSPYKMQNHGDWPFARAPCDPLCNIVCRVFVVFAIIVRSAQERERESVIARERKGKKSVCLSPYHHLLYIHVARIAKGAGIEQLCHVWLTLWKGTERKVWELVKVGKVTRREAAQSLSQSFQLTS